MNMTTRVNDNNIPCDYILSISLSSHVFTVLLQQRRYVAGRRSHTMTITRLHSSSPRSVHALRVEGALASSLPLLVNFHRIIVYSRRPLSTRKEKDRVRIFYQKNAALNRYSNTGLSTQMCTVLCLEENGILCGEWLFASPLLSQSPIFRLRIFVLQNGVLVGPTSTIFLGPPDPWARKCSRIGTFCPVNVKPVKLSPRLLAAKFRHTMIVSRSFCCYGACNVSRSECNSRIDSDLNTGFRHD